MEDLNNNQILEEEIEKKEEELPKFRGLYRYVKISVKLLLISFICGGTIYE